MKGEQDYIRDIADIRSMMERSSKFLSLSGWAGVMAGMYALAGAGIAYNVFNFNPGQAGDGTMLAQSDFSKVILLAAIVLALAVGTAVFLSQRNARKRGEKFWNPITRRLLVNMLIPLVTGGLLLLVLIAKGFIGLAAPLTLIFYGLALFSASNFTYREVRSLGLIQIALGLVSACFTGYGLLCWAIGFGVFHIIYGIYMHYRYER